MKPARKLKLVKETLAPLHGDELGAVVAGAEASGYTCPIKDCLHSRYNCPPSFDPSCMPTCHCTPQTTV